VASHSGDWSVNPATNSLDWSIPLISADESSGSLEFSANGDESTFFPVRVSFVGSNSLAGVSVAGVTLVDGGSDTPFSQEASVTTKEYVVV
jgi:coatomer subunit delta